MSPSRPRLIPHKRALLPPKSSTKHKNVLVPKVLNTNATSSTTSTSKPSHTSTSEEETPIQTEFAFASHPQPFLDPPAWASMTKRRVRTAVSIPRGEGFPATRGGVGLAPRAPETADRRSRREWEAEVGSMAIRGRSGGRGRGRGRRV